MHKKRQYLKDKIDELATNSKNRTITQKTVLFRNEVGSI
jgi:hypothetical protein